MPEQQSPDAVTDFPAADLGPDGNDCAYRLVAGRDGGFGSVDTFEDLVVCVAVACGADFEEKIIWSGLWSVDAVDLVGCVILQRLSVLMNGHTRESFACCDAATTLVRMRNCDEP